MQRQKHLPAGKLPADFLSSLIRKYTFGDRDLLTGPGVGEDAAVIGLKGRLLIAKTDPVTFAAENLGYYAVNVNANDVAAMGGVPRWFFASLLLPEKKTTKQTVKSIFADVHSACKRLGVVLCGGHTEITSSVRKPIIAGCMLGEAEREKLTPSANARPGDDILLTKKLAIEGVSVIAGAKENELKKKFSRREISSMKNFAFSPGISVVKEAVQANTARGLNAMHDPTEGGLSSGIYEVAAASGTGALIESEAIPVLNECEKICAMFGLNPLGLISSGSLLLYCNPSASDDIIRGLGEKQIPCCRIGRVTAARKVILSTRGKKAVMPRFDADEITRVL